MSENERKCKVCKQTKPLSEFANAGQRNGVAYHAHKCKLCYNAGRIQVRNPERAGIDKAPHMVIYDKSTGRYVEYQPVRIVNRPAKQVDRVLQFQAARGLLVFKMKLGG